jgi:signal transduction histidine kinase
LRVSLQAAAEHSNPSVDQVSTRQKTEQRSSSHAKLHEIVENLLVRRIDHQTPTQVADSLGLEAEYQVHLREISIELGVVEFFFRR